MPLDTSFQRVIEALKEANLATVAALNERDAIQIYQLGDDICCLMHTAERLRARFAKQEG